MEERVARTTTPAPDAGRTVVTPVVAAPARRPMRTVQRSARSLVVGSVADPLEREADRAADQVVARLRAGTDRDGVVAEGVATPSAARIAPAGPPAPMGRAEEIDEDGPEANLDARDAAAARRSPTAARRGIRRSTTPSPDTRRVPAGRDAAAACRIRRSSTPGLGPGSGTAQPWTAHAVAPLRRQMLAGGGGASLVRRALAPTPGGAGTKAATKYASSLTSTAIGATGPAS